MTGLPPERLFGLALCGGHGTGDLVVERSDGRRWSVDLGWWRGVHAAVPAPDRYAVELAADGPVLDVRCGTGRRLDLLTERGLHATGIDTCPEAVSLGCRLGRPCVLAEVGCYWPPVEFGTVLALGTAVGSVGSLAALPGLLRRLAALTFPGGTVLAGSIDWRLRAAHDARFVDRQRRDGRYPGEVRLRLRLGAQRSDWFDWVWVDRDAMADAAVATGFSVVGMRSWRHHYVARLVRR